MYRLLAISLAFPSLVVSAQEVDKAAKEGAEVWVGARSVYPDTESPAVVSYGLTHNDLHWLRRAYPDRPAVAVRTVEQQVSRGARNAMAAVVGVTQQFSQLCGIATKRGRFLDDEDVKRSHNVCVVNQQLAAMTGVSPGDHLRVANDYFMVVGICEPPRVQLLSVKELLPKLSPAPGNATGVPAVYMPLTTMKSRMGDIHVMRQSGTFNARQFQLSEIWIAGAAASRVRSILESLREENRGDYRVGERIHVKRK